MAELLLYDYTETEIDPFWGDTYERSYVIGEGNLSAAAIAEQINQAAGQLVVRINSCGGYVYDGWAIYNALVSYAKKPGNSVVVRIEGLAASIASVIAMAGSKITMCQASMLMMHKPTTIVFDMMDSSQMQAEANALNEIEAVLIDIYANKTGLSKQKLQNLIDSTTWLSPDNAVALGFADEVEKVERDQPIIGQQVFNKLFNSESTAKAYVNSIFTIKQEKPRNMSTVSVKDLADKQDTTNTLLRDVINWFKKEPKNQAETTEEKKVEETTETKTEETKVEAVPDELTKLKEENEKLKSEAAANSEKVSQADEVLNKANAKYDEVTNLLRGFESTYIPKNSTTGGPNSTATNKTVNSGDVSQEEMLNRKQQYKNKK